MTVTIGITMAMVICLAARFIGLDRDRAFYPLLLMAIASYDLVFAALTGGTDTIVAESLLASIFIAMAVIGFRKWPVWVLVGLIGHALADLVHPHVIDNPGIPNWWPGFCAGFDAAAALALGGCLYARRQANESGIRIDLPR